MHDYLSLLIVLGVAFGIPWLLSRLGVWHKCRCGRQYCTGCGKER